MCQLAHLQSFQVQTNSKHVNHFFFLEEQQGHERNCGLLQEQIPTEVPTDTSAHMTPPSMEEGSQEATPDEQGSSEESLMPEQGSMFAQAAEQGKAVSGNGTKGAEDTQAASHMTVQPCCQMECPKTEHEDGEVVVTQAGTNDGLLPAPQVLGLQYDKTLQGAWQEQKSVDADMTDASEVSAAAQIPGQDMSQDRTDSPTAEEVAVAADENIAGQEGQVHPLTLEWLRDLTVEDARQYLLGVTGAQHAPSTAHLHCNLQIYALVFMHMMSLSL